MVPAWLSCFMQSFSFSFLFFISLEGKFTFSTCNYRLKFILRRLNASQGTDSPLHLSLVLWPW